MKDKEILIGRFSEIIELCERLNKNIGGILDKEKPGSFRKIYGVESGV